MSWGEESDQQGFKFREVEIPQGLPDPEGELIKTQLIAPQSDPLAPDTRSAERDVTDEVGGEAWKRQLRPRHRDVVKKYFTSGSDSRSASDKKE